MTGYDADQETQKDVVVHTSGPLPQYQSEDAAGADIRAEIESPITITPGARYLMPTNIYVKIPKGYEGQIRPRSGLAIKHGITLINSPGTIDSDYRGEIKVPLINMGTDDFVVHPKDRIAQLVISPCVKVVFSPVEITQLSDTTRGSGGFGSSGVK